MSLLEVRDLHVEFGRSRAVAVHDLSFTLDEGQRLGLIGESGSGKSVTALAIMGLLPDNAHVSGSIRLWGRELLGLGDRDLSRLRGDLLSMVFQEPLTALDPTMRAGRQVAESLRLHRLSAHDTRHRVLAMLGQVGISDPARIADSYPHQLSGGQRQRVLMAMALINDPSLLICDEPTTALDVTVQATVLRTLDERLTASGAACLFISHDLAIVSRMVDRLLVMREGRLVEQGSVADLLTRPREGYTRGLVATARLDGVPPGSRLPVLEDFL
ncbi:ABC transporter ATP-binding protein [Tessaracoccus sp. SD287]|uniref:ATP-binding cassette domain-containing protein n=1 Tax=Tessaracoccus sp. SD287 TaxID=2782008 RepID=UPI001A97428C|nr:ABC transporter ATP-binding protein [Tessaracoccus sp. SD287]MBO1030845.1 ABC transporter ATP-binding protein [Tessaracoccus sp. SD287]